MSWRELSKEEREDIRKRFSMADYDALLAEIDRLLNEEVDDGQPV
ncbi:hypothetical protein [Mycolicibacterium phlei]|nr:hypothetical protein [Mycolicibacterium phlei]